MDLIANSFSVEIPHHKYGVLTESQLNKLIADEFKKRLSKARIIESNRINSLDGVKLEFFFTV